MTPGRSHFVSDRFTRHLRRKHDQSLSRAPDPASKQDPGLGDSYSVVASSQKSPSLRQQTGQPEAPDPNGTNKIQPASPTRVAVKSEDAASVNSRLRGLSVEEHPSDEQPGLLIRQSTHVVASNKRPAEYDNATHPKTRTRLSNPAQANENGSIPLVHRTFEPEDSRVNITLSYSSSSPYVTRQNSRIQRKAYSSAEDIANAATGRDPEKGLSESPIQSSPPSKDTEFGILLQPETRTITHKQLINEVKGIYAGLIMVEKKCVEIDGQQASSTNKLSHKQYQALIALHRTLLHEHHDFFLTSQYPSASPSLRKLATRYAMPARMWRHEIYSFLKLLRHRLSGSFDHILAFVYLSYSMIALSKESVPSFEETWIECLEDLAKYRMIIEEADLRDREVWAGVARMWYNQATNRSPNVDRIQHHLAVLARPNIVQQLFYYSKALVSLSLFQNVRESIMSLFNQFLDSPETASQRYPTVEASLVQAVALLFSRGSMSIFDEAANQFVSSLDPYIGRVTAKFRVQGPEIACGLLTMLMDFGIVDSVIWQAVRALDVSKKQSQDSSQELPNQVEANTEDPTVRQKAYAPVTRIMKTALPGNAGVAKAGYRRKAVRIFLNGQECIARPDSGSDKDIMSEDFARRHGIAIQRGQTDKGLFKMGNGKCIQSIGRAYVPCSLFGDAQSQEHRWFHVLVKCVEPLIVGMGFLQKTELYTKYKHLLVDCPPSFGNMPTLKYIGSPQGRISFTADGNALVGCADTGSDLDFISLRCAIKSGFKIDRQQSSRTRVMLPDFTIIETVGQIHVSSLKVGLFDSFERSFHVLPGLPCDIIFGEEFLEQIDAFNTCSEIIDSEDPYLHSLNTLINLGPIQTFLSRKWTPKTDDTAQQMHDYAVEAEIYRRNKANRSISRMLDENEISVAGEVEAAKRREFDRGHENCVHCIGGRPRGTA